MYIAGLALPKTKAQSGRFKASLAVLECFVHLGFSCARVGAMCAAREGGKLGIKCAEIPWSTNQVEP